MKRIAVEQLSMSFLMPPGGGKRLEVLDGLSFRVEPGEFVSVLGPTGCGKTTLLRLLAGLLRASEGAVFIDGRRVEGTRTGQALIFQDANLLPWRTAAGNAVYGLEILQGTRRGLTGQGVAALKLVGLETFAQYYPFQLSGGMKQRVGIARALAVEPEILLCDEPFAALDALTREGLEQDLCGIAEQKRLTVVFVTHDIDEAIAMSDRVLVLSGRPAKLKADIAVPLRRPRAVSAARMSEEFLRVRRDVVSALQRRESNDQ